MFAARGDEGIRPTEESELKQLAGSTGVAEYYRILRQHGVRRIPNDSERRQPARLCAKDVFGLLEELRRNAREKRTPTAT